MNTKLTKSHLLKFCHVTGPNVTFGTMYVSRDSTNLPSKCIESIAMETEFEYQSQP